MIVAGMKLQASNPARYRAGALTYDLTVINIVGESAVCDRLITMDGGEPVRRQICMRLDDLQFEIRMKYLSITERGKA